MNVDLRYYETMKDKKYIVVKTKTKMLKQHQPDATVTRQDAATRAAVRLILPSLLFLN